MNPVLRVKIIGNVIMYVDVRDYTHSDSHSSTAVTGSQVIPKVLFTLGVPACMGPSRARTSQAAHRFDVGSYSGCTLLVGSYIITICT